MQPAMERSPSGAWKGTQNRLGLESAHGKDSWWWKWRQDFGKELWKRPLYPGAHFGKGEGCVEQREDNEQRPVVCEGRTGF